MIRFTSLAAMSLITLIAALSSSADVYINEFHYDNTGTDENEFIEIVTTANEDPNFVFVDLYNGNGGVVYDGPRSLTEYVDHGIQSDGNRYYSYTYDSNGIQNGAPDGLAVTFMPPGSGFPVEFLSYEGTFMATDGFASGLTSTDVGVAESSATPIGSSLQLIGGTWIATEGFNTKGTVNSLGIPEPGVTTFLLVGLFGLTARRRKR
jgi:hypothetical protein